MISAMLRKVTDGGAYKAAISRFVQFYRQTWTSDIYQVHLQQQDKKEGYFQILSTFFGNVTKEVS
jgi:hypothetical protein